MGEEKGENIISKKTDDFEVKVSMKDLDSYFDIYYQNQLIFHNILGVPKTILPDTFFTLSDVEKEEYFKAILKKSVTFLHTIEDDENKVWVEATMKAFRLIIQNIRDEMLKQDKVPLPAYIRRMIDDEGLLFPDGKRVMHSLDDVAVYLKDQELMDISIKFLMDTFRKPDGRPYSKGAAKAAVDLANTSPTQRPQKPDNPPSKRKNSIPPKEPSRLGPSHTPLPPEKIAESQKKFLEQIKKS